MRDRWKQWKSWKKWTVSVLASVLLISVAGASYLYYQIKSIDLADIEARIEAKKQGTTTATQEENKELPSILNNSLEKANSMASKSVSTQDALDVAAILLNSGLSLKEVYYLIGQS